MTQPLRAKAPALETFVVPEQELGLLEVSRRGRFSPHIGAGIAIAPSVLTQLSGFPNVVFQDLAGARIASEVAAVFRRYEKSPTVQHFIEQIRLTVPAAKAAF